MKGKISFALVLFLIMTMLIACRGNKAVVGTWSPDRVEIGETSFPFEEFVEIYNTGHGMNFIFTNDGKAVVSLMGERQEGIYKANGDKVEITLDGEIQILEVEGDSLLLGYEEMKIVFIKD